MVAAEASSPRAAPPKKRKMEEREEPEVVMEEAAVVVEEAQGLKLHLSSRSSTGYKGVTQPKGSRKFRCVLSADGKSHFLGNHDTAIEAAVAYAKRAGPPKDADAEAEEVEEEEEEEEEEDEEE